VPGVATVAWRLQTANVADCRDTAPLAGFSIDMLDQYRDSERAEAQATLALREWPQISAVVPGSAAAKAGIRVGDEIVAVNDVPMPRAQGGRPSYERTALAAAAITAGLARPPAKLGLRARTVYISGDPGCKSEVQLVPGPRLDAQADGHYVRLSGAMYEFTTNDAELAFAVAHELAHNLFPEAHRVAGGGKRQRAAELAADRLAIAMMARAGYDTGAVIPLLERLARRRRLSWLDGTHPAWQPRIAAAAAAVAAFSAPAR